MIFCTDDYEEPAEPKKEPVVVEIQPVEESKEELVARTVGTEGDLGKANQKAAAVRPVANTTDRRMVQPRAILRDDPEESGHKYWTRIDSSYLM